MPMLLLLLLLLFAVVVVLELTVLAVLSQRTGVAGNDAELPRVGEKDAEEEDAAKC